jgi:hypothetical protein
MCIAAGLVGALALPMTLTTAMKVAFGSKWLVALRRAQAAGKMLAIQLAQVGTAGGQSRAGHHDKSCESYYAMQT